MEEQDVPLLRTVLTVDSAVNHADRLGYMEFFIKHGNIEQLKILLAAYTSINNGLPNPKGMALMDTALRLAGEVRNMEVMKTLLEAGATTPSVRISLYRHTTLWHAVEGGDLEVVNMVLAAGADAKSPSCKSDGTTPLQQAAKQGNMELVDLLLKAAANAKQPPPLTKG